MSDKLDILVDTLSDDLQPVKPLRHPLWRILPWAGGAVAYMVLVTLYIGIRPDVQLKLDQLPFLFEIILTSVIAVTAALAVGWLSVPDMRGQKWILTVPAVLLSVFALWLGIRTYLEDIHVPHNIEFHKCSKDALLLAVIPVTSLVFLSRVGNTTRPLTLAAMSALSIGALGWIALRFTCVNDTIGHTFCYHFLPFVLIGMILGLLARKLYSW